MYSTQIKLCKWAAVALLVLLLPSCSTVNSKVGKTLNLDTDLKLSFDVAPDINPDDQKTPAPLFIRFYELKSAKVFERASFLELFERDKEVLGGDMLAKQQLKRIRPGEDVELSFVLDKSTQAVGLFAEFLRYDNSNYKVIIPVVTNNVVTTSAKIKISGNSISIVSE